MHQLTPFFAPGLVVILFKATLGNPRKYANAFSVVCPMAFEVIVVRLTILFNC